MKIKLASGPLRLLTLKMGPSGSFALPVWVAALLCLLSLRAFSADTNALAKLENVHRIVFLGDSITYAGGYVDDIEAYYVTRFRDKNVEFINVGLSSETVSGLSEASEKNPRPDLHERLGRVLEKTKPDLVFVCYGMNDGIYHPPDEARLKAFEDGMKSVHAQIAATGTKIIHITPPVFDPVPIARKVSTNGVFGFGHPYRGYNETLDQFSAWLVSQRAAGWEVADLHGGMNRWLAEERQRDPNFNYTKDGVHPDAKGHWTMAKQILLYLGAKDVENIDSPAVMVADDPRGDELLQLVHEQEQLLRDAWLNFCGFNRPGVKGGLPVPEAEVKAAELTEKIRRVAVSADDWRPTLQDFLGEWVGKWDDVWSVRFKITENPDDPNRLRVVYQWEENVGQPMEEQRHAGFLVKGALNINNSMEIVLSLKNPNQATAIGHFTQSRVANLIRMTSGHSTSSESQGALNVENQKPATNP